MEFLLHIMLYVLMFCADINCQACTAGTDVFGVNTPSSQSQLVMNDVDTGVIMLGNKAAFFSDCCGVVDKWQAVFDLNSLGAVDIYFQVWRPSGGTYELIGENMATISADGDQTIEVGLGDEVSIMSGDRFGWYASRSIISYKNNNGADNNYKTFATKLSVGDFEDWSGATVDSNPTYALRIDTSSGSSPTFSSPTNGASFIVTNDEAINFVVTTVAYSDNDIGDVLTLTSTLDANTQFAYDTVSGDVYVNTADLGPDTETLTFDVTDFCGNTNQISITITVTNQAPVIHDMPQAIELSEDTTAEALLYTVNATDNADGFTCDFTAAVLAEGWPFTMRQIPATSTYGIYVDILPNFDYSVKNSYALLVECTDDWGAVSTAETFNVYLQKNQAPVVHNLQASTIVSTSTVIGTTVFSVNATDNENDQIYMSMVCDPSPCPFTIFDSGDIQLNADISSYTTTGYDINVTVWDAKNVVGPKILTIIVKDINDPVLISNLPLAASYPVSENTALSSSVFQVSHSDQDTTQNMTYSMSSTPGSGLSYFSIDSATGLISTSASNSINYEALSATGTTSFNFVITVHDGTASDTQPLTIDIIDVNETPSFSQNTYSLSTTEGPANTIIGTPVFGTTDPDSGDSFTYSMDCGTDTGYFHMDTSTGEVKFQSDYDIDAGMATSVTCTVNVTDTGGLVDTATLNIYISDANDNTPFFSPTSYSDHISYYASVGTSVLTVSAFDNDVGTYGTITYSLDQTSLLDEYFTIDNTGKISVLKTPNGNAIGYATSVTVTVTATDGGGLSDTASVTITIGDTTTTSTTTTTDRYRTFIEDSRNIAWLVVACLLLAVILVYLTWLLYTCQGPKGWGAFTRSICNRRKQFRPRKWKPRRLPTPMTPYSPPPPRPTNIATIRNPPPPVGEQHWRSSVNVPPLAPEPVKAPAGQRYEFWKHTDFTENRLTKLL